MCSEGEGKVKKYRYLETEFCLLNLTVLYSGPTSLFLSDLFRRNQKPNWFGDIMRLIGPKITFEPVSQITQWIVNLPPKSHYILLPTVSPAHLEPPPFIFGFCCWPEILDIAHKNVLFYKFLVITKICFKMLFYKFLRGIFSELRTNKCFYNFYKYVIIMSCWVLFQVL